MKNGIITLDSKRGKLLGFTSNLFEGYLWKKDDTIIISFIVSKQEGQGNLSKLFNNILKKGYKVNVPTPMGKMLQIVRAKNFKQVFIEDEQFGLVETWEQSQDEGGE